jgi:two-component system NtrC family sensor kinase
MPVRVEGGRPEQLLVHVRDMTEQMQLEAQIIERERFAATGRLAATVAHEVNTPLQAIESCLHLAGRVADEAERARYLRLAREEIQRVGYTLRQLLDLYRPSGSRVALDINGLIERVLLLTGNSLARQSIQIDRDFSTDLPPLIGRADEITQVLINLAFNAMQAMPRGGRLGVQTARAAGEAGQPVLCIRVRDTGVGIAPELHERIFEPFFTTRPDGTGLGLAVCRRIIDAHGGTLRVESEPGAGSCFIIEIPRP